MKTIGYLRDSFEGGTFPLIDRVWLVRHGMRLDIEDPDWRHTADHPHDTPLSRNGVKQAHETASHLKNAGIDHVFASPFLRTLQTADIIAKELGLKINIEYGFCEWLNPVWFPGFPEIVSREEARNALSTANLLYHSLVTPVYPEHDENVEVYSRVKETMDNIFDRYSGSILIVGHGSTILQAGRYLLDPPTGLIGKMCAVNGFERADRGWELTHASKAHLTFSED